MHRPNPLERDKGSILKVDVRDVDLTGAVANYVSEVFGGDTGSFLSALECSKESFHILASAIPTLCGIKEGAQTHMVSPSPDGSVEYRITARRYKESQCGVPLIIARLDVQGRDDAIGVYLLSDEGEGFRFLEVKKERNGHFKLYRPTVH